MPASTISADAAVSPKTFAIRVEGSGGEVDCTAAIDIARKALDTYLARPADIALKQQLVVALGNASVAVSRLPRKNTEDPAIASALVLIRAISEAGVIGQLADELTTAQMIDARAQKYWPGLLARMLIQAPWRSPVAPSFAEVPDWLWGEYSAWVFSAPPSFYKTSDVDDFARHALQKMNELAQWVSRNVGSPAVRSALQSYLVNFSFLPLTVGTSDLKRQAELHARILTAGTRFDSSIIVPTGGRVGRPLRVAFVGSSPAAIPEFSRLLDPNRFEISLYVLEGAAEANGGDSNAASFAIQSLLGSGNRTRQYQALAADLPDQLSELQSAGLDIAIFPEELTASNGRLHQLALRRLAPLHVFTGSAVSTGLPTADLFVTTAEEAGAADLADQFTERLAVRAGCHLTFADLPAATEARGNARANLGFPEHAFVMMTAARAIEITPCIRERWVELLRSVPTAYLAIQLLHVESLPTGAIESFAAEWDRLLKSAGVDTKRLLVLGGEIGSLSQVQSLVVACDVFLDVGAFAEPDLLNVPLGLHIPIVTLEGGTFRSRLGAGLLRSLGLESLIAQDGTQFQQIVERLATNPEELLGVQSQLRGLVERLPICRDLLAASESLGFVLEDAYDDLHANGARIFRSGRAINAKPDGAFAIEEALSEANEALVNCDHYAALEAARKIFRVAPAHSRARVIAGRASMGASQFARAVDYLLAAVQTSDDAGTWFDLAVALYRNNQHQQAVQALETSLRLDASRADAWTMLVNLANEVGAHDIAREALTAFKQLAPFDPRVAALEESLPVT